MDFGYRPLCISHFHNRPLPAITCRWRSRQNFPRRIVLADRFRATNSELALAQPGHQETKRLRNFARRERRVTDPGPVGCLSSNSDTSVAGPAIRKQRAPRRAGFSPPTTSHLVRTPAVRPQLPVALWRSQATMCWSPAVRASGDAERRLLHPANWCYRPRPGIRTSPKLPLRHGGLL